MRMFCLFYSCLTFLCLTKTATENKEKSNGTITNQDNSGIVGVGVGFSVGEVEVEVVSPMVNVCVLLQPLVVPVNSYKEVAPNGID